MTAAGARRELARYQLPEGTRAIVAQRIDGRVALTDMPVGATVGRVYLIERHVNSQAELTGLVAAYVAALPAGRLPRRHRPAPPARRARRRDRLTRRARRPARPGRGRPNPYLPRGAPAMPKRTQLTDAEREQRRAADRERLKQAAEQLLTSDGWQRWVRLRSRAGLARLSLSNQLLVALARPDASFVAGFKAWLDLGYCVGKGEKAIRIIAPMPVKERDRATGEETGETITLFKGVSVFDAQQVKPLPSGQPTPLQPPSQPLSGDSHAHLIAPTIAFAESLGYTVSFEPIAGSASGWCDTTAKKIVVDTNAPRQRAATHARPRDNPRPRNRLPALLPTPSRSHRRHHHPGRARRPRPRRLRRNRPLRRRLGRRRRAGRRHPVRPPHRRPRPPRRGRTQHHRRHPGDGCDPITRPAWLRSSSSRGAGTLARPAESGARSTAARRPRVVPSECPRRLDRDDRFHAGAEATALG